MPGDYANLDEYAKSRSPVYPGTTFDAVCAQFITPRQTEMLRKLPDFSFTRHLKLNLPDEHLENLEKFLRKRASQMVGLSRPRAKTTET